MIIILAILHSAWTKHQEERQKEQEIRMERLELFIYSHDYDLYIIECLKEINENNSLSEATVAEMEEVCPLAAERLYQEVICLEKSED